VSEGGRESEGANGAKEQMAIAFMQSVVADFSFVEQALSLGVYMFRHGHLFLRSPLSSLTYSLYCRRRCAPSRRSACAEGAPRRRSVRFGRGLAPPCRLRCCRGRRATARSSASSSSSSSTGGRGRRRRQSGAIIAHHNMKGALRRQRGIVRFLCSEQSVMCKPSVVIHIVRGGLLIA
jgi:hypothetical protein